LLFGRTESIRVKGVDLFCRALNELHIDGYHPSYTIRGEKAGNEEHLYELLKNEYKAPPEINIKPYSTNKSELLQDIKSASLVVLPSRGEGFGLAAVEAISLGIPTIVSDKSGIGMLINQLDIDQTIKERFIWKVGESDMHIGDLRNKIAFCLENQEVCFEYVKKLRVKLIEKSSWKGAAKVFTKICQNFSNIELMEDENEELSLFMQRRLPYLRLYDRALEKANESIDILSIKLNRLRERQGELLLKKSESVKIRIALLDPCFPLPSEEHSIASIREQEEKMNMGEIRKEVAEWYFNVWEQKDEHSQLDIRLFKALPTINLIKADSKMFVGSFLLNENDLSPTFIVENKRTDSMGYKLYQTYLEHFEIIWNSARSFDELTEDEINAWKDGKILQ
jgi:hypothetical protein